MKTRTLVRRPVDFPHVSGLLMVLAILALFVTEAAAQVSYPRVGLSASPHEYIDTIDIAPGEEFTLYACVFGPGPGEPVGQPFTSLSWVIHQVCCGAEIDILDFQPNPDLEHTGHPLLGVRTTSEVCYDRDLVILGTMRCNLTNPTPGGVLWAAGPYDASFDCEGGNALFMGMAVTINADGDPLPTEDTRWGSLKALYR
ncbi:MAG: hypothetical protein ABFS42_05215 [Candidatus Krumholzibacteriota bacterium]